MTAVDAVMDVNNFAFDKDLSLKTDSKPKKTNEISKNGVTFSWTLHQIRVNSLTIDFPRLKEQLKRVLTSKFEYNFGILEDNESSLPYIECTILVPFDDSQYSNDPALIRSVLRERAYNFLREETLQTLQVAIRIKILNSPKSE